MKFLSWNVNGLRAVLKKDFSQWLEASGAEAVALQEIKCTEAQLADQDWAPGWHVSWNPAEKAGYSGTLLLSRRAPLQVRRGLPAGLLEDREGRVLAAEFPECWLVTVYTPNAKTDLSRLPYREREWDPAFLQYLNDLNSQKPVVACGDFNVAHTEIDLARPGANKNTNGFTEAERAGFTRLLEAGFVDTFREFEKGGGHYTWWSFRGGARARNVGWRLDYFLVAEALRSSLQEASIENSVTGSDHCPVGLELAVSSS
jgi:exodeoxyribonuclease III